MGIQQQQQSMAAVVVVGAGPMQEVGRIAQKVRDHRKEDVVGDDKMSDPYRNSIGSEQACMHARTHTHTHTHTHAHTCTRTRAGE